MALRQAARERTLRKMSNRPYTTRLAKAEFHGGGQVFELTFGPGVTVLCGGNGAGKSRTLGALIRCIASGDDTDNQVYSPELPHWLSSVSVAGSTAGEEWTIEFDGRTHNRSGRVPAAVVYIDPSMETETLIRRFRDDDNREDLKEGVDPAPLHDNDVLRIGYILRRSYTAIRVYEVTAFSEDDTPTPYFEVDAHGHSYDLLGMGRGELMATYLLWRLRDLEPGTVVLIEEPESHLAAFSQRALIDAMVSFAADRDLTMVISSHSPGLINSLPDDNVVLLKGPPEQGFRQGMGIPAITGFLGIPATRNAIVVVEDLVAAQVLRALLQAVAPAFAAVVSIRYAHTGESGVHRVLGELRHIAPDGFALVGILDGDQRGKTDDTNRLWHLPGTVAPEALLRGAAERWRADTATTWTPNLPGGVERLRMALENLAGQEHHDWLMGLGKHYGDTAQVISAVVDLVLDDEQHRREAEELADWLKQRCDPAP
ncbi:AAA family ATPase [Actinokineospora terrae]|uniref:AAA family ATPase n=1 Tax=Actinokineospora terrae TaxID=155974 RepID=UPI000B814316|nr:AAA family ATPase [Actinokineospora terrae]